MPWTGEGTMKHETDYTIVFSRGLHLHKCEPQVFTLFELQFDRSRDSINQELSE